jgi:transcription termination/antitermination protein NusG
MIVSESCDATEISSWFAIQTLSRHEKMVRDQLARRNVEHFLPTTRRINQWTDRRKEIEVPLFAGYCFVRLSWADRLAVLQSQGVVRFVGCAARAEPIPDEEINSLRTLVKNSSQVVCHPYLKEGMLVEVTNGPLQGIKGRLVREARCARLVLNVTLIQRAVAVEIDAESVVPALNDHELCRVQ